jgi:hypothetical protein
LTEVSEELTASIITLMIEAVSSNEMLDNICHTAQRYIPKDRHFQFHQKPSILCLYVVRSREVHTVRSTSCYHVFQTFSSFIIIIIIIIPIIVVAVNFQRVVL